MATLETNPLETTLTPGEQRAAPTLDRNAHLIALLERFAGGDAQTQARDLSDLQRTLQEGRPGQRPLFGEAVGP